MALGTIWQLMDSQTVKARMVYAIFRSRLHWPVCKLHIARKYMFYLLYYTEYMD